DVVNEIVSVRVRGVEAEADVPPLESELETRHDPHHDPGAEIEAVVLLVVQPLVLAIELELLPASHEERRDLAVRCEIRDQAGRQARGRELVGRSGGARDRPGRVTGLRARVASVVRSLDAEVLVRHQTDATSIYGPVVEI